MSDSSLPADMRNDDVVMFFYMGVLILVPPLWVEEHEDLHHRFWKWRYIYLGYFILTTVVFLSGILEGEIFWLFLAPFAHVLAPILAIWTGVLDASIASTSIPYMSDFTVYVGYSFGVFLIGTFEFGRRYMPEMFQWNPYEHEEDEFVIPLEVLTEKKNDAETPPKLDQTISTALVGETGSGKTSSMKTLAYQFQYEQDTAVVAHDYGKEFQDFFYAKGFQVIRISSDGGDITWNLFRDAESEQDFREIAAALFGEPSGYNPFHGPARQVFQGLLTYLYREAISQGELENLGHHDIVKVLNFPMDRLHGMLQEYDDLHSKAVHLDPDRGKGAKNVYQTMHEHTEPVFVNDFGKYGTFSIKEYVENPRGRVLVIDSEPSQMATLGPMFQVVIDWSIRYAMNSDNPTVHILDEIDQLPELNQVTDLTARGRAENARALIGVQTVGQLSDTYSSVSGILGNCPQGIYFGPGDRESTDYIFDEIGEVRESVGRKSHSVSRSGHDQHLQRATERESYQEQDRTPFTSGVLKQFEPGECVVKSRTDWWRGKIHQLADVEDTLPDSVEVGAENPAGALPSGFDDQQAKEA